MKEKIIDFNKLTDSRELLEAKPPKVLSIFIYSLFLIFITAFFWMYFGRFDIVVKSAGIIRPMDTISIVRNIVDGEIKNKVFINGNRVKKGDLLFVVNSDSYESEKKGIESQLLKNEKDLEGLIRLKTSISSDNDKFDGNYPNFYNQYLTYKYQHEQLRITYLKAKDIYERNSRMGSEAVSIVQLEEYKSMLEMSELNMKKFESETAMKMDSNIEETELKINLLKENLVKADLKIQNCHIRTPINGMVQSIVEFNEGDYLNAGTEVLKIIPDNDDVVKVEIVVSNKDITNLRNGMDINYIFPSLPRDQYGIVKGKIISIPEDISNISNNEPFYTIQGSIINKEYKDIGGKSTPLKKGMLCDARIIVNEQSILDYVLEKLDFIN